MQRFQFLSWFSISTAMFTFCSLRYLKKKIIIKQNKINRLFDFLIQTWNLVESELFLRKFCVHLFSRIEEFWKFCRDKFSQTGGKLRKIRVKWSARKLISAKINSVKVMRNYQCNASKMLSHCHLKSKIYRNKIEMW